MNIFKTQKGKLTFIVTTVFVLCMVLFSWGVYMLFLRDMYYSVNIETFQRDNKTVTQAFERESVLRRNAEEKYTDVAIENIHMEVKIATKDSIIAVQEQMNRRLLEAYQAQENKLNKITNERDSILRVINSLERVD